MTAHVPTRSDVRTWALSGTALIAAGVVAVLALHAVTLEEIDPLRRTLSQYGLGPWKPVFDAGVLAVAIGSVAVLAALARARLVRLRGAAATLMAAWSVCLMVVVAFEDRLVGRPDARRLRAPLRQPAGVRLPARGRAGAGPGVAHRRALGPVRAATCWLGAWHWPGSPRSCWASCCVP